MYTREDYEMWLKTDPNPGPKTSGYDQEMPESRTTDLPTAPRERNTEPTLGKVRHNSRIESWLGCM